MIENFLLSEYYANDSFKDLFYRKLQTSRNLIIERNPTLQVINVQVLLGENIEIGDALSVFSNLDFNGKAFNITVFKYKDDLNDFITSEDKEYDDVVNLIEIELEKLF